ncbi:Salicylate carboxymethyltransferase [Sesamum alatum]|uniref:Salicylate carboxymethyltransferase n=1 Tax=Sesamum alatum TaxID=300844 RepID=A0AAE1XTN9_9LAMI|nr:Salicylate carboxymethyltransferase [Sesamum alatum]
MDLEKVFHMKGGLGGNSYANNSSLQRKVADAVKHITLEAIEEMFTETRPKSLGIADLGCSSGPNTLSNVKELVYAVEKTCRKIQQPAGPEFRVYLNDLPTNDFNTVFQALPEFYRELRKGRNDGGPAVYIAGCPGTFYGRLFPDNCLHFVYSSNSLHWLSRVPPGIYDEQGVSINKKSIYISERSPSGVAEAFLRQFQEDLSFFLKSRSEEVVSGGKMVLLLLGRSDPCHVDRNSSIYWEMLYHSLATLVTQGEIEEEKLESYEVNFYAPSKEELEEEVRKEGSFKVEVIEKFEQGIDIIGENCSSYGQTVAKTVRSIQESMIAHHFGEDVLDKLFDQYARLVDQEMAKQGLGSIHIVLVLTRL